ncbi:cobalt-zinc-cadmium efflux system outer membrane protein [Sphingobacterium soli]|uniref:Cation transporter n=1 Tax=Sphingobacterium cellulitidis TaxID=1768011 RepID=A0A8H9G306_9SPHI|nr:cobalt-zinc-cadmium efflux system outer membrane protein [Sphingobacterium soli]GGE26916.1 cation transporter [Sphingobacterium soli]
MLQAQTYSVADLENLFQKNNLQLIAKKYDVNKAEALLIQEKLWPNPTLTVDNLNLWANKSFETMPNLIGNYGSKQQLNMELEQLIETAGKRKKRIAIKKAEQEGSQLEFEEVLRQLRLDLRNNLHSIRRLQLQEKELNTVHRLFSQLNEQYKIQAGKQHISQVSYFRVNSELIGIQKELLDLKTEMNDRIQELRVLTQIPELGVESIVFDEFSMDKFKTLPSNLKEQALRQNIYLQTLNNEILVSESQLRLEKAHRTPNFNLLMNYERGGNVMNNFIGFGLNIDLPIFNRNKGNIQAAKIQLEQNQVSYSMGQLTLGNEIDKILNRLEIYNRNLEQWQENHGEGQVEVLENYIKYLQEHQVTLIEFIDFAQAQREAQQAFLELQEKYSNSIEELQYLVGKDLQ